MTTYAYYYKYSEHSQSSQGSLSKGSSLPFSAQGGRGKEKYNAAKKFASPSEGAAEGGCGGNSAAPERSSPAALLVQSRTSQKSFLFLLEEKIWRTGIRKAKKTFLWGGERQRAAAGRVNSVQSRFALRSVIATNQNLTIFQDEKIARSPRLRRVSLRKKPVVWRLNQTAGEARRGLFCPAGGGSGARSAQQMKFTPNFFLCRFAALRSQFFNPTLYGQRRLTTKL